MRLADFPLVGHLFSGIPGPFLAKSTSLWFLYHLLRGTYRQTVTVLHQRYGPVVQVAPRHYSLEGKQYVYIPKLIPTPYPSDSAALHELKRALAMDSFLAKEPAINECNRHLLALLPNSVQQEDIPLLVSRYAWDVMLMVTTGQSAGFLDSSINTDKIEAVLRNWKFYSILYGSYLRYHPYIARFLRFFTGREHLLQQDSIESRVALCLAAADPAIVLISAALQHILKSQKDLLSTLRDEIELANIETVPSFQTLILSRPRMPMLYAVLQECACVNPPRLVGPTFTAPNEGISAAKHQLPPGHLASIENITQRASLGEDAHAWDLTQWLDHSSAASMKRQLLAFNISAGDNIEQFQILLTAKLLVQIITRSERPPLPPGPTSSSSEGSAVTTIPKGANTPVTLAAADIFTTWLSKEDAEALLTGRLAPHHKNYSSEKPVFTRPIFHNYDRAMLHEAVRKTHGEQLAHFTHPETNVMCIAAHNKIPRDFRQRKQQRGMYRGKRQQCGSARGPRSAPTDPRPNGWGNWAEKEGTRQDYFKTEEGYRERQDKVKQDVDAQKQRNADGAPEYKFKETFKQTGMAPSDGKLGGIRKAVMASGENEGCEKWVTKEIPKGIPPHMRRSNAAAEPDSTRG